LDGVKGDNVLVVGKDGFYVLEFNAILFRFYLDVDTVVVDVEGSFCFFVADYDFVGDCIIFFYEVFGYVFLCVGEGVYFVLDSESISF